MFATRSVTRLCCSSCAMTLELVRQAKSKNDHEMYLNVQRRKPLLHLPLVCLKRTSNMVLLESTPYNYLIPTLRPSPRDGNEGHQVRQSSRGIRKSV